MHQPFIHVRGVAVRSLEQFAGTGKVTVIGYHSVVFTWQINQVSDAFHMLFDCIALVIGLCGLVIAEWTPNKVSRPNSDSSCVTKLLSC